MGNKFTFETKARYYYERNDNATLARRYNRSVKTIRTWKRKGLPNNAEGNRLRNAINRTGKKYAYENKMRAVKERIVEKLVAERQGAEAEVDAARRRGAGKATISALEDDVEAARIAEETAKNSTAEELVGLGADVRTDRDWRAWEASYEANKGVIGL